MDHTPDYAQRSLSEVVVLYIKNKILSGEFKSGDKLVESDISNDLNISRAPVREALRTLNVEGMITLLPRKGNHVLIMSRQDILEIYEIRISLEMQVLQILVHEKLLTPQDFENLRDLTLRMMENESKPLDDNDKIFMLNSFDMEFHKYLWTASKSQYRVKLLEGLFFQLLIAMNKSLISLGTFEEKAKEHMNIIYALESNRFETVVEEFRLHLMNYIYATVSDVTPSELQKIKILTDLKSV